MLSAGVLIATIVDLRTRRIPNTLTAGMTGAGFGLAAVGVGGASITAAVLGFIVGFVLMLPGHLLGATGAGDVKLMAAIGTLVGPALMVKVFLFTAIAGGVLAVVVALRRRNFSRTVATTARMIATPTGAPTEIRSAKAANRFAYGPAIAVGSVIAVLLG